MSLNVARRLAARQAIKPVGAQPIRHASSSATKEATKKDPELIVSSVCPAAVLVPFLKTAPANFYLFCSLTMTFLVPLCFIAMVK